MSVVMDNDFADWLMKELSEREWSQSDLANRAGVPRQVISTYINRQRKKPDSSVLISIARALRLPPEEVFRRAGLLPPRPEGSPLVDALVAIVNTLAPEDQEEILEYARYQLEKAERRRRGRRQPRPAQDTLSGP